MSVLISINEVPAIQLYAHAAVSSAGCYRAHASGQAVLRPRLRLHRGFQPDHICPEAAGLLATYGKLCTCSLQKKQISVDSVPERRVHNLIRFLTHRFCGLSVPEKSWQEREGSLTHPTGVDMEAFITIDEIVPAHDRIPTAADHDAHLRVDHCVAL